ncbi:hypothetical protein AB7008_40960 [Bradyrhizobium sp. 521_C7_N1_3]|uniref:hypothetical protein n=1 Tax=Bradyrhizobium sp. 521_C7_N1_3 TaxID=3240368 RepID=UPI003F8B59EF
MIHFSVWKRGFRVASGFSRLFAGIAAALVAGPRIQRRQKQIEESVARYMSQLDTAECLTGFHSRQEATRPATSALHPISGIDASASNVR